MIDIQLLRKDIANVAARLAQRKFILDEYCFSLNLARYGLKVAPLCEDKDLNNMLHLNVTTGTEQDAVEKAKRWLKGEKVAWAWQEAQGSL